MSDDIPLLGGKLLHGLGKNRVVHLSSVLGVLSLQVHLPVPGSLSYPLYYGLDCLPRQGQEMNGLIIGCCEDKVAGKGRSHTM